MQINAFPNLVVVEREGSPHALQRKVTGGAAVSGERDGWLNTARSDSWDVNISFYRLLYVAKVRLPYRVKTAEGRRSRRNSKWFSGCMQMDLGEWSDMSAWFIRAVNHALDHSYFRRDSLRLIRWYSRNDYLNDS